MYTLYITFSQSSWTGLFVVLSLLTASIIRTTFAFAFWNYFWTTRGRPEWNVKQWSFNYLLGRQVNFKQHPARMWSQFVLCCIILSFCLPSSCFVSPALVCLLSDSVCKRQQKSCRFRSDSLNFYPQEGKKLFSLSRARCYFLPKKGFPLSPSSAASFSLSLPVEILSSTLFACCQLCRNALNPICEGHRMCPAYFPHAFV